jgi:endoglucanase
LTGSLLVGCANDEYQTAGHVAAAAEGQGCRVEYAIANSWNNGFTGKIRVFNSFNEAMTGWTVDLAFKGDEKFQSGWGAQFAQNGRALTMKPQDWAQTIQAGSSVEIGFTASVSGTSAQPDIKVNHPLCGSAAQNGNSGGQSNKDSVVEGNGGSSQPVEHETSIPDYERGHTPVARHGQLKVVGTHLVDQKGAPVQLKGMSSHGLQWFGGFMNYDSIKWLRDDWRADLVRAAMYTKAGGYIDNPSIERKTEEVVEAAIKLGMYVIIDWHILDDGNPNTYRQEAKAFFSKMARKYGKYPNVIYEIANEPNGNGVTWDAAIRPYAVDVVNTIRAIDPDNIVIVGTGMWDQMVVDASRNPLDEKNIVYALHFYAGGHDGKWIRGQAEQAIANGIALFVSEWGASHYDGGNGLYLDSAREWMAFLDQHKISWANWSLCDKDESSAALMPGASPHGGWKHHELSPSGRFVREAMRK